MITIPKAGQSAGASAQLQVATDQSGSALAGLGDRMVQLGHQWRMDKVNRESRRAQIGITQDMALLRQDVDQLGDTAQIGPAWDAGVADIRKRYVVEGQDPLLRENVNLAIDDLAAQHSVALADRVVALGQSQDRADFADFADTAAKGAGGADETTYEAYKTQGLQRIADMQAAGRYTPEEAQKARSAFLNGLATPRVSDAIAADPAAALADIEAGKYDDLSSDSLAVATKAAQTAVATAEAAKVKAAAVADGQTADVITKQLDGMADMMDGGNSVQGMAFLVDPKVTALAGTDPKVAKALARARASADLQAEIPGIHTMTPSQLDTAITLEAARPKDPSQPWDADRLDVLKKWRDQMAGKWAADPISAAISIGLANDAPLSFDPANPGGWSSDLGVRMSLAASLQKQGFAQSTQPFTVDERAQLKTVLDPKADAGTKLALAAATVKGAGQDWATVATAMGVSDEMRGAMSVLAATGDTGLAGEILRGQQKLATDTANLPPAAELVSAFTTATGGLFAQDPATSAMLMKAAAAAYADRAPPDDPKDTTKFVEDSARTGLYAAGIQQLLGATSDAQGRLSVGGIQTINGAPALLPRGISAAAVQTTFDHLATVAGGYSRTWKIFERVKVPESPAALKIWQDASFTGKSAPDLGDDPAARLAHAQLVPVPNRPGLFTLRIVDQNRALPIPSREDPTKPYVFRLSDLISGAAVLAPQPQVSP